MDDVTAHAFVLVVLRNMYKIRSKISRPLAYVWMQCTDDERCVRTRACHARVRTPNTRPGLDTRVPGSDVWAASLSG